MAKLRHGFVSNSSSSSFLIVTPIDIHNSVYEELHPYVQAVVDALTWEEDVLGMPCQVGGFLTIQDEGPFEYIEIHYDSEDVPCHPITAWNTYVKKLRETGQVFINMMDD